MRTGNPLAPKGTERPDAHTQDDTGTKWQEFEVSYDECLRLVRMCKKRWFFIRFAWLAPTKDQANVPTGKVQGFEVSGNVHVSKRELLRCLDAAYGTRFKKECCVRVTISDTCFFVGGA